MNYLNRIEQVREKMAQNGIDVFITLCEANYFYLTGFDGSAGAVIITKDKQYFITDSRYITQSKEQTLGSNVEIIIQSQPTLLLECVALFKKLDVKMIGFEADRVKVIELETLKTAAVELKPLTNFIETIRYIKEPEELKAIGKAIDVVETVFTELLTYVKPGMTEIELAMRMEMHMRKLGASGTSFDTIVASGLRGALPHGHATDKVIESGDFITTDFGAIVNGYCSDMTRTFAVGTPNEKLVEIYNVVLDAQLTSSAAIEEGKTGKEIDAIARTIIGDAGYGAYFGHGLGHAVGIEIHEAPGLRTTGETILTSGMVVTVEPGIYIEGLGGVRIEDMILVEKNKNKNLMSLPKDLIIV